MPPVPRRPVTFEDLQRVQGKVEQERRSPNRYDQTRARRYIFNEALNAGDLDRALYENQQWSDYNFDEGSDELRSSADIEDFRNAIPFRGQAVDKTVTSYNVVWIWLKKELILKNGTWDCRKLFLGDDVRQSMNKLFVLTFNILGVDKTSAVLWLI